MTYATLDDWIRNEAVPFSLTSPEVLNNAIDRLVSALDESVCLLGFGEALHGSEETLVLRNRLFQRLTEAHGYSAIAIESSFPKGQRVNEYVLGRGSASSYDTIQDTGFSHGVGQLDANRELVEWMRQYNVDPSHRVKLRFYGADSPTEMTGTDSPREVLHFVLDYLDAIDGDDAQQRRKRINDLLGSDVDWENPAALIDPTQSIGLSDAANALRVETEELIAEMERRRPELAAKSDRDHFLEALQHAVVARQMLTYHAGLARPSDTRIMDLLGIRDAMFADNLTYAVAREQDRGRVLVFAHNRHLQRSQLTWDLGGYHNVWWPAGAHLDVMLGKRYVVIGSAVGVSADNGIGQPEPDTLEGRLMRTPGPIRFIPTRPNKGLPEAEVATLPTRTGLVRNSTYGPLSAQSLIDFDWLAVLDSTTYNRGGPPLPDWEGSVS